MSLSPLKGKVLVLGADTRGFLAVIRSLGRAGLEVHTAWCPLDSPALRSRYVRRNHLLPHYRSDDLEWLDAFGALLEKERFDLVLPCTDAAILPLQLHRARIESSGRVHLLPSDVYWTCANKARTHALARQLGVPVPRQIEAPTLAVLRQAAIELGFPVFLKPETSSRLPNPFAHQKVNRAGGTFQLDLYGAEMLPYGPVLAQQNVSGMGVGVEFLSHEGEILTAFQHERVHEAPGGGRSGYRRSVPLDPAMYGAVEQLARALKYTGVAMVEFKQDPATQRWVLLEVNARVWGSLPLAIAAGLDFPRYLYEMLVLGRTDFPKRYRANLYCRHWTADLGWLSSNASADRRDKTLMIRPKSSIASEIFNMVTGRERSDTFQFADPLPALLDLKQYFATRAFDTLQQRRRFRARKGAKAAAAFANARRILFVCYGNICRSPFAAEALRKLCPDREVASSGYHPAANRCCPPAACEAATGFGIDLTTHRSAVANAAAIEQADLIFVFDRGNRSELIQRFAQVESKVHFLGSLDPDGPLKIGDPFSLPVKEFESCYARVDRILRVLAAG